MICPFVLCFFKEPLRIVDYIWMFDSLSQLTRAAPPFLLPIVLPDCNCGAELEAFSHRRQTRVNTFQPAISLNRQRTRRCSQRRE